MRGAFIVIEGCDRVGKSTQCTKLVEALNNQYINSKLLRFPDRDTETGKVIDLYLKKEIELPDQAVHLLFAANRWELVPKMMKLLNEGVTLVVDRYSYSGVAYTAAKKVMELEWCKYPEIGLPKPDLVLYLHLSEEEMNKRKGFGGERYEQSSFQKVVSEIFLSLKDDRWQFIDANKSVDQLHEELVRIAKEALESAKSKPISTLW